jgi:hypothetical protein
MIAQSQEPKEPEDLPALVIARRLVAARLLSAQSRSLGRVRRIPAWKIWFAAAWVAAILAACCLHWLRIW